MKLSKITLLDVYIVTRKICKLITFDTKNENRNLPNREALNRL